MTDHWPLWIRAETEEAAAEQGRAWADAEPALVFVRVVSVTPREFHGVWTVVVETTEQALTLGLVG